jgi:multiple sugar transport system substrate-binding protein
MINLNLSICGNLDQDTTVLRKLLEKFQDSSPALTQVDVKSIPWEVYRQELTTMVVHNRIGDVSQVGAPVASDMMAMNTLRPFSPREVEQMGGKAAFVPVAWQNTPQVLDKQIWAIPWLADPRVFFYWRDLIEQAKVDEETAFQNPQNLTETVRRIQSGGVSKPWGITVGHKHSALHTVASWVWANGGDFISTDGKRALFLESEALAGLKAYFSMIQFMAPESQMADYQANNQLFANHQSAIILGNGETATYIVNNIPADMRTRLGVALPFGIPLVGGSSLVVWAKTQNDQAAVSLVQFLVGRTAQAAYPISLDHLPVRLDVLNEPPYTTDPILKGLSSALYKGRVFPITKLSGLLEEHLGNALVKIWASLFANPTSDLEDLILSNLTSVVRHYDDWME